MEYFKYLLTLTLLSTFLANCNNSPANPENEEPKALLSASPEILNIGMEGGTLNLSIKSIKDWSITNTSTWCRSNIQRAAGNVTVQLTVDESKETYTRSTTLTVSTSGAEEIKILINQEGSEPGLVEPVLPSYIAPDETGMRTHLSSIQFSQLLGLGWNMGNSLESIEGEEGNFYGDETSWHNPPSTQQLFDGVKAAGFNVVRIPVAYSHMFEDKVSYKIKGSWKKRIKEVVQYAINSDLYAMINIHWDGGWMNHCNEGNKEAINAKIDSIWRQMAIFLRDFDDHLIFAAMNEVGDEELSASPATYAVHNSYLQTFVNAVRATGGRNTYRFLAVQGYWTNIDKCIDGLVLPTDATPDRLMVEVHYYDPWQFCFKEDGPHVWEGAGWAYQDWADTQMKKMKTNYVDKGIPVLLGEYGVWYRDYLADTELEEHIASIKHYLNYVKGAIVENGLVPFYWDNGSEHEKLFDRTTGELKNIRNIEALTSPKGSY